jgi:hypothetical protein
MKTCRKCKEEKSLSEFNKNRGRSDGVQTLCRQCDRDRGKAIYENNKEAALENNRKQKAKKRAYLDSLKNNPCSDCGQKFPPCAMDFDHVRGTKVDNVSSSSMSYLKTQDEIQKCDLVCANCHRVRTWERRNKVSGVCGTGFATQ